ncbi:MAG: hypothetical protein ACNA78_08855 [Balneolaceae bacterium]
MKHTVTILISTFLLMALPGLTAAQNGSFQPSDERSSFQERRKSILDANTLRASYHNYGFAGRTSEDNRDELFFEFPKNTNRRYLFFKSVFTGAEVQNQQTGETMQIVVAPNFRTNPQDGSSWAKNPVFGYFNENSDELARSDRGPESPVENTWPPFWPDKMEDPVDPGWPNQWNGFFGKDIFNADQEFYYRSGDDLYTRFSQDGRFLPDSNDPSRGGLGLIMDTRVLAWTQNLISSVHFNIFEIRNDSEHDFDKVSFMLWTADWLGTPSNDRPFFDQERSIAFYTDTRPTQSPPEFDNTTLGVAGIRFLETPGNAVDGIDNNGDSDFYNAGGSRFRSINADLYGMLIESGGGFIDTRATLADEVVPPFTENDFLERQLSPGDPIVLIDGNSDRILLRYPPAEAGDVTVITQGREFLLPAGGLTVREDTAQARNFNLLDDDLDGLIDENQPSHLTLGTFRDGVVDVRPVRYINYRWSGYYQGHNGFPGFAQDANFGWAENENGEWEPVDTRRIQRGLIIPDSWIEQRMQEETAFADLINDTQESLRELYSRQPATPIFPESFFDRYFQNRFTSAPMIDESREDFFDNNQDWELADDVGIDGSEGSGARGEADGRPSSGAFTPFPGEPNIDKTDVQETDAIGITSATIAAAGALGGGRTFLPDATIWRRHMVPGAFDLLTIAEAEGQDSDQFLTSGFFPLNSGSTERFAVAITVGQTGTPTNTADLDLVTSQLESAFRAFDANYQFAIAPPPPALTAIPGNGRVTLYWDDEAEEVFDRFLERIGANPRNFEGYRIYRTTDPALADARRITDGRGNLQFLAPIAQFDLDNGIKGNHPIDISGVEFFLGEDTGIRRSYIDTDIINGRTYFYVVTAYNSGAASAGIAPSESPISLSQNPDGSFTFGSNVKRVIPSGQSAGYVGPAPLEPQRISGEATGSVFTDIIDPDRLKPDNLYRLTFTSEEVTENGDTFDRTTGYSLQNVTEGVAVFENRTDFNGESIVVDGVQLTVINDDGREQNSTASLTAQQWRADDGSEPDAIFRSESINPDHRSFLFEFDPALPPVQSEAITLEEGEEKLEIAAQSVNLRLRDAATGQPVAFAFRPSKIVAEKGVLHAGGMAAFYNPDENETYADILYILDENGEVTWQLNLEPYAHHKVFEMDAGASFVLQNNRQFNEDDVFEFFIDSSIHLPTVDADVARAGLDNIRVVPNPYVVTNVTEPRPTGANPRLRQLHFTNLPAQCTIRIFTVSGRLVQTLHVDNDIDNGRFIWDMLTKDNLDISFGVYLYHVTAPGVGETTGRFAVIK